MQFKNIPGNQSVKNQLLLAYKHQRLSHAHLFLGEDGSAALPIAWAFSQFLICENKQENDSCGECPSCLKCSKLSHPDLHWVFPVTTGRGANAVSDHFISDWRESIQQNLYQSEDDWYRHVQASNKQGFISVAEAAELSKKMVLKTFEGSYRVVIIWHAEKMHAPTSNKLLKLLEEPPEKTIFILMTPQKEQLIDTIVSRLQSTDIQNLSDDELKEYLKTEYYMDEDSCAQSALLSSGNIGQALNHHFQKETIDQYTDLFKVWIRSCYLANIPDLCSWIDDVVKLGREQQKRFFQYALHMVRECLVSNFASSDLQRLREEELAFTKKFAPFIHEKNSIKIIEELELALQHIGRNASAKIVLMDLSLKVVLLLRVKSINLQPKINQ